MGIGTHINDKDKWPTLFNQVTLTDGMKGAKADKNQDQERQSKLQNKGADPLDLKPNARAKTPIKAVPQEIQP